MIFLYFFLTFLVGMMVGMIVADQINNRWTE